MKRRVLFMAVALALTMCLAPASAYYECYPENYGGTCATTCVIYDDESGNVTGWIRGPLHQC